ncbi:type II secretion system protein [Streptomyces sp. NPDC057540]|uniref:type II secretion system protein n=1 Tax=Streptomyces sp. NPDC057540 TaxID=3346160 RepID=UPI0036AB8E8A
MSTYLQGKLRRRTRALNETAEAGFTLIELLVVIVILGVLSAIVVFSVKGINDKGQDAACDTDKATIATAEEAYYASHNKYASMDDLEKTFLSKSKGSKWYRIELVGDGVDYSIEPQGTTCS